MTTQTEKQSVRKSWRLPFLFLFILPFLIASGKDVAVEEIPQWVNRQQIPSEDDGPAMDQSAGVVVLLADEQVDIASETSFQHYVRKIVNAAALQNETKLTMSFDPSFQRLVIHHVRVHRNGKEINLLDQRRIKVVQREQGLEYDLYDGRLTAIVLLEDIRVEDVLDYAFSLVGSNPIFNKKFLGGFQLQWNLSVKKIYYRMLVPSGRTINIAYHGRNLKPFIVPSAQHVEYVWRDENVKGITPEPDIPAWYFPFSWIQMSEFRSWQEVAGWASELFTLSEEEIRAVQPKINELKENTDSEEEYIQKALRFVQDDIRYFGVEIGINSHRPIKPSRTLRQRFGDCKDKTLLFCALLRSEKIDATPVLVNSQLLKEVARFHPSPLAFNHVIVRVVLFGKEHFFDPTLSNQRGVFTLLSFPAALKGLVVDPAQNSLVDVDDHSNSSSRSEIQEHFIIQDFSSPAILKVTSTFYGNKATMMRSLYSHMSARQREQFGSEYYTKQYYNVTTVKPMNVTVDNEESNILSTTEEYLIDSLWQYSEEEERLEAYFNATLMSERFRVPRGIQRTMPLATNYPSNLHFNIRIDLPEQWQVPDVSTLVEDSAFTFSSSVHSLENRVEIEYRYITLRDFVPPEQVRTYAENVKKSQNEIGYALYNYTTGLTSDMEESGPSWIFHTILICGFLAGVFLSIRAWRSSTPDMIDQQMEAKIQLEIESSNMTLIPRIIQEKYTGIKGWLVLPAIHLILSPLVILVQVATIFYPIFNGSSWHLLTTPGFESYHPLYAPVLIAEMVLNVSLFLFTVLISFYFFRKKKQTPKLMIYWYALTSFLPILDAVGTSMLDLPNITEFGMTTTEIVRSAVTVAIWIPYFISSQRVKDTFVY